MNNSLERLIADRATIVDRMNDLQNDKIECEGKILGALIDQNMWECFTINWRKLERMITGGRKTRRMDSER